MALKLAESLCLGMHRTAVVAPRLRQRQGVTDHAPVQVMRKSPSLCSAGKVWIPRTSLEALAKEVDVKFCNNAGNLSVKVAAGSRRSRRER